MKTVFTNGNFFTDAQFLDTSSDGTCMVIEGDQISYIGDQKVIGSETDKSEYRTQDLGGRTVLPGFIDGHMHLLQFGLSLRKVSLEHCKNLDDIRSAIKAAIVEQPTAERILCRGWMHSMTDGVALASMLDDLSEKPIFVDSKDLHSTWCNTPALKELGVQDMADPAGGEIHRDANGRASGLLSEAAAILIVWPHIAKVASMEHKLGAIKEAVAAYNAAGYTGMIEMAMDENAWAAIRTLREQEGLDIRLAVHWLIAPSETNRESLAQVDKAIALHQEYNLQSSPDFRIAGIKVICDGVIDACTAALIEPYTSNAGNCDPIWDADMLKAVVQKADAAGLQCALHAIGDATIKLAIDAIESTNSKDKRHRIEHLELSSVGDAQRLHQLGITASIQAVHADPAILRAWPDLLGPERCGRAFAYREFLDSGVNLALGTDAPTAPTPPLHNLYVATTRRSAREPQNTTTVNPHFALPFVQALAAASAGSARSCFAEKMTGSLAAGKKADFIVVDMEATADRLLEARVLQTWFDGRQVFEASSDGHHQ